MEKKFSSSPKTKKSPVKNQAEKSIENKDYNYLRKQVSQLKQNLTESLENEQKLFQKILNLEMLQQHYYEERKNKLLKYKKPKSSSSILSSQIKDLDIDVQNLMSKYIELSSQNKSLQGKLKTTHIQNNKQIKESQMLIFNNKKKLIKIKSSQFMCNEAIQRINLQIQKLNDEKERISGNRIIDSQNKQEIAIATEKARSVLKNRQEEMQNLQEDLKNFMMKYEALSVEKDQRLQNLKKNNHFDENQIKENIELLLNERKKYDKKIKKIKKEDISDLNFHIESASKELNHLIEAHEMRNRKQIFVKNALDQ